MSFKKFGSSKEAIGILEEPIGVLFIQWHEAKEIPVMDITGKSDPFLKIYHEGFPTKKQKYTSSVKMHTLNPKWTQEFCFGNIYRTPVQINIQCWDKDFASSEYIGEADVILDDQKDIKMEDLWVTLEDKKSSKLNTPNVSKKHHRQSSTGLFRGKLKITVHVKFGPGLSKGPEFALNQKKNNKIGVPKFVMKSVKRKKSTKGSKLKELKEKSLNDIVLTNDNDLLKLWLVSFGSAVKINGCEYDGHSVLHIACMDCQKINRNILSTLVLYPSTDINVRNISQNTPLHYLCANWQDPDLTIFDNFFDKGADPNALNHGLESPMMKAITNTSLRKPIIKKLLSHGANTHTLNSHKEGIIHYAARLGRVDLVSLILRYSDEIRIRGSEGLTPREIAAKYANSDVESNNQPSQSRRNLINKFKEVELKLIKAEELLDLLEENNLLEYKSYLIKNELYLDELCNMGEDELQQLDIKMGPLQRLSNALSEFKDNKRHDLGKSLDVFGLKASDTIYAQEVTDIIKKFCHQQLKDESLMFIDHTKLEYLDELGRGASGAVWRGFLHLDDITAEVAIKVLFAIADDELEGFKKELKILRVLSHPNVVKLYGVGIRPKLSLVMEFCSNGSLYHALNDDTIVINWNLIFSLCKQIVDGLGALHSHNPQILHRDLKSLNILLTHDLTPKLADFGLSLETTEGSDALRGLEGTAAYLAPEIVDGAKYNTSADIYSLGVVFWEIFQKVISGKYMKPYDEFAEMQGPAASAIIIFQASEGLRPTIPEACPSIIKSLIQSCWHKNPLERPEISSISDTLKESEVIYKKNKKEWDILLRQHGRHLQKRMRSLNLSVN